MKPASIHPSVSKKKRERKALPSHGVVYIMGKTPSIFSCPWAPHRLHRIYLSKGLERKKHALTAQATTTTTTTTATTTSTLQSSV